LEKGCHFVSLSAHTATATTSTTNNNTHNNKKENKRGKKTEGRGMPFFFSRLRRTDPEIDMPEQPIPSAK